MWITYLILHHIDAPLLHVRLDFAASSAKVRLSFSDRLDFPLQRRGKSSLQKNPFLTQRIQTSILHYYFQSGSLLITHECLNLSLKNSFVYIKI